MTVSLAALGELLRQAPIAPSTLVDLFERQDAYQAFRDIVRDVVPDAEAEIMGVVPTHGDRESARVSAFLHKVEAEYFPVYELEEYEQVLMGVPYVRNAWAFDQFHELDLPPGELLLFALCAQPYEIGDDNRLALLDAAETHVGRTLLTQLPADGLRPAELHERLDGTSYAPAAEYADWLWGETGSVFLDIDDEMEADVEWTRENVRELARQWQRARAILDRTGELARWLEQDPATRFARLLDAALGRDASPNDQRMRRCHARTIDHAGVAPDPHDAAQGEPISPGHAG